MVDEVPSRAILVSSASLWAGDVLGSCLLHSARPSRICPLERQIRGGVDGLGPGEYLLIVHATPPSRVTTSAIRIRRELAK